MPSAETFDSTAAVEQAESTAEQVAGLPPAGESLRGRAIKSSVWMMIGWALGQVIRFGGNLILSRLLFPELFGLMALVNVFFQGLQMFSDVGIGPAIIQNKKGDEPRFVNTAWTIQCARGFVLTLVGCLLAWPIAKFYREPRLVWLFPLVAANAALAGFNS